MSVVWAFNLKEVQRVKPADNIPANGFTLKGDNGSTVVLIHGLTGTPNEMRFLANYLNKRGYTVICPRLAYHGDNIRVLKHAKWQEFYESVNKLNSQGMKSMILDLRNNSGGMLGTAIELSDEFLKPGKRIVYTRGINSQPEDYYSTARGLFEKVKDYFM